ncbi:putative exported protein, partial [Operophtera brumata]
MTRYRNLSNTIYIHEVPRVKIIAEKFSRYKLNNVELRKLDEKKLSEREVEMIDSEIAENRPYLDDLRKILRRKEVITTKHKNSLDLQTLYDLATMEHLDFEGKSANLISKEELHEVKDLILKTCKSSVHGINRRTVRREGETNGTRKISAVSQSIVAELHREEGK